VGNLGVAGFCPAGLYHRQKAYGKWLVFGGKIILNLPMAEKPAKKQKELFEEEET
jgi:hypothetical protein